MHITRYSIALTAFPALSLASPLQVGIPVKTTSGLLTGTAGRDDPKVSAYLGVPFADPPVGAKRWTAPVRFRSDSPRNASAYAKDCAATSSFAKMGSGTPPISPVGAPKPGATEPDVAAGSGLGPAGMSSLGGSGMTAAGATDDCLYLNLWTPPKKTGDTASKAVMIWLYGGAFVGGGTSGGMYDGSRLASTQDVIVVTTNYRLGIFGFPGAPGLPDQNLGLLDQRSTVEWVRDNIAAFGGDPKRITLFGMSAGGMSVDLYSYAWTKDPIVAGLISESGASTMCGLAGKQSYDSWKQVAASLNCASDPAKELECMRSKSTAEVQKAAKDLPRGKGGMSFHFIPVIDEKVVFEDYFDRGAKGLFIKAPYIIGNNDKEMGTQAAANDAEFVCPASHVANSRRAAGVPVWRYRFYGGGPAEGAAAAGVTAGHGAEVPFVFGSIQDGVGGILSALNRPSPQKTAVSRNIQKVWADFAKDPTKGPISNGWPHFDPTKDTQVRLMYKDEAEVSFERGDKYDAYCVIDICRRPGAWGY